MTGGTGPLEAVDGQSRFGGVTAYTTGDYDAYGSNGCKNRETG